MIQFLTYFIAIFLLAFSISTKTKLLPGATEKILNKIHILFSYDMYKEKHLNFIIWYTLILSKI